MSASADHARKATISFDEWCLRMQRPGYRYLGSEWYKAGKALEAEAHAAPPPNPGRLSGNRCVYFSQVVDSAITRISELGAGYTALFSADLNLSKPGSPYFVSDPQLHLLRDRGVRIASWCDCEATPYSAALLMAEQRQLDFAGGQAETIGQYLRATQGGATHLIGEPSMLAQDADVLNDAIRRTRDGSLTFIGEVMHADPSYSAQGVNISSACFYVDRDQARGGYQPLSNFRVMPASLRNGCSIYTGGRMSVSDWDLYAQWTKP